MSILTVVRWILVLIAFSGSAMFSATATAQPNCAAESRITHNFDNGSQWDLCWESRIRENLVLSDIHFTPPGGEPFKVLASARLSQLHVAYDDSDVTYNDVTQFGLGGSYLTTLDNTDCPTGRLLDVQTRPALCLWETRADNGHLTPSRGATAASLNLFSVSQVGAYAYVVNWKFYDDGTFEPGVGATGALQRSSDNTELPFGRVLQGDPDTLWLSHTHTYYWRLDFDLGTSATDDVVSELRYQIDESGRRNLNTEVFATEQARIIDPAAHLLWRIMDNASATAPGYQFEPVRNGHRFERKEVEPYTEFDFFVTVGNDCERFASQNARFNPDCLNHVLQYVDGQSIEGEDVVLWNRVSFHHTPRSEDQRHMHTHWDDFSIRPVNLLKGTSGLSNLPNTPPEFAELPDKQTPVGELVHGDMIKATDTDDDMLSYSGTGLPPGLELRPDGHVHGHTTTAGRYTVQVSVRDDHSEVQRSFNWTVGNPDEQTSTSSGGLSSVGLLMLLLSYSINVVFRRYPGLIGRMSAG